MRSTNHRLNHFKDKTIAVIGGGISNERDVSLNSAQNVFQTLKSMGLNAVKVDPSESTFFSTEFDIAFNCLHGKWGEDGGLQGYCELKQIPYTGPGLKATSIGLNKPLFKMVLSKLGLPVPNQYKNGELSFPLVLKPISEGSSIGIKIIKSDNEFEQAVNENPEILSRNYFFEEYISGQELTAGVITIDGKTVVLPILEIKSSNEFLDYEAKYTPGKETFILPAQISKDVEIEVKRISKQIYDYFECKGCIRIDMIIKDGKPKVLEMNTSPGLTNLSYIPAQAAAMGIDFDELMIHYLNSAI